MTLRRKIVSLTFGILVVFALTALFELILQDRIGRRFTGVVSYQIPLNAAIAEIDVLTDQYELQLLRLVADLSSAGANGPALLARHKAEGEEQVTRLSATIVRIKDLIARALMDPGENTDDRIALAEIRGRFSYLERAMPDFIGVGRSVSAKLAHGEAVDGSRVAAEFAPYRMIFGGDLAAIRTSLAGLSVSAAGNAARMQRELVVVETAMLGLAALIGIGLALVVSNRMMAGLTRLIEGTQRIQEGHEYEVLPVISRRDEIGMLTLAFNRMVEDLRAKDRIKETFGKYIDPRIVTTLIEPAGGDGLAERQASTVFFSDIKGFSGISELLTAPTMVKLLNTYFTEVAAVIQTHNGIIDKYIGDGVMAFWTAPFSPGETHAADACIAALKQQEAVQRLREHLSEVLGLRRNLPEFAVRMGIATGDLVVGTIGSPNAQSFTVIGDTVNLASRLEGANKAYRSSILVNEEAYRLAQHDIEAREIDLITVVGKTEPVRIYEVMGITGTLSTEQQELRGLFAEALAAYQSREWNRAEAKFAECLAVVPTDGPSMIFAERVRVLREQSLPPNWDGVWHLAEK